MIHIKLHDKRSIGTGDPMGRDWVGYDSALTLQELFENNRGRWRLGPRAESETHAVFSYTGDHRIKFVAAMDGLEDIDGKKAIVGSVLEPDDPVAKQWVGMPAPDRVRNPVTYVPDSAIPPPGVAFTPDDCQLFEQYAEKKWPSEVPEEDRDRFKSIRARLKEAADWNASVYPGSTSMRTYVSRTNPNAYSPPDLWLCVFPDDAPHHSYSLQITAIIRGDGAELCFCLGAGRAQLSDPDERHEAETYLVQVRNGLSQIPSEVIADVAADLGSGWVFRREWRSEPASADFDSLADWIDYVASENGSAASISRYLKRSELEALGTDFSAAIRDLAARVAPLIDDAAPDGDSPAEGDSGESPQSVTKDSSASLPPPSQFEQGLSELADVVYGKHSGTQWTGTARFLEQGLGPLGPGEGGAISITDLGTLNNRLVSPGLVRTSPKLIVVFSSIGAEIVDTRLDEFIPLTRHLSTVAIAERGRIENGEWIRDEKSFESKFVPDPNAIWRVRRIVEIAGVGIASQIAADFPLATVRSVPLTPILPSSVKTSQVDLSQADMGALVSNFGKYLDDRGLVYPDHAQLDFLAVAMASQFVLFAGPSGSGKSTAARALADFFSPRWVQIEVPRGLQRHEELVGYYSHFSKIYADTVFLGELRKLDIATNQLPPTCILEESNLSPFEGYMSAGLHGLGALEAPKIAFNLHRQSQQVTLSDTTTSIPQTLDLGPYPRFYGTVNVDATAPAPANKISGRAAVVLVEPPKIDDALAAIASATAPTTATHTGEGAGILARPTDALRLAQEQGRDADITEAIRNRANALKASLKANVITPRDASRIAMFIAAFDLVGQASGMPPADALDIAGEYALIHYVLPRMAGEVFDKTITGLAEGGSLREDGPLLDRVNKLVEGSSESGFGIPAEFWTALS